MVYLYDHQIKIYQYLQIHIKYYGNPLSNHQIKSANIFAMAIWCLTRLLLHFASFLALGSPVVDLLITPLRLEVYK